MRTSFNLEKCLESLFILLLWLYAKGAMTFIGLSTKFLPVSSVPYVTIHDITLHEYPILVYIPIQGDKEKLRKATYLK